MDEQYFLLECKRQIEIILNWQKSSEWKNRDFENLAEIIFQKTSVLLSVSTLKRIWKSETGRLPQTGTLNTLAMFAGFESWAAFKSSVKIEQPVNANAEIKDSKYSASKFQLSSTIKIILPAIFVAALLFVFYKGNKDDRVELSIKTVQPKGLPNTVIFNYSIEGYEGDSLFFQPSWNIKERKYLDPEKHLFTAIYYFPGIHHAKIISSGKVIKTVKLKIESDGWLSAVRYAPDDIVPKYIAKPDFVNKVFLSALPDKLKEANIDIQSKNYWLSYFNIKDFGNLDAENFVLETMVSNPLTEGGLTCRLLYLYLHFENGYFVIPFGDTGCANKFHLILGDVNKSGTDSDLSMFGCNLEKPVLVGINCNDKKVAILVNDVNIFDAEYSNPLGRFHGIHYFFYGSGKIESLKIGNSNSNFVPVNW